MNRAILIPVGDELLSGNVVDTNSGWIAHQLDLIGIPVIRIYTVPDDFQSLLEILEEAQGKAEIVIITGGLGPTKDDVTKSVLAHWSQSHLKEDTPTLSRIQAYFKARGKEVNELNAAQAIVPDKAEVLPNHLGTAPGLWLPSSRGCVVSLPGVPFEMKDLMIQEVLPRFRKNYAGALWLEHTLLTLGIPESELALHLKPIEDVLPPEVKIAYLPQPGLVKVKLRIQAEANQKEKGIILLHQQIEKIKKRLGGAVAGEGDETPEGIIHTLLLDSHSSLSTAESCTGGALASSLLGIPGASAWFLGGMIPYQNQRKNEWLGVENDLFHTVGAVSEPVAKQMAEGIRSRTGSTYGIGITGIAGPGGATPEKPVGTVWISLASPDETITECYLFERDRQRNIRRTCLAAIDMLRKKHLGLWGRGRFD
jgi:nicotinamide-nucleotide amidase